MSSTTLGQVLCGAEQLLIYAIETGIAVDADVAARIIAAKGDERAWQGPEADKLAGAIATLAAKVRPVTAHTLASCRLIARKEIQRYSRRALLLVLLILPLSVLSFFTSGMTNTISAEIESANSLVVALHTQLYTPGATTTPPGAGTNVAAPVTSMAELQQFAATIRSLRDHTLLLQWFVPRIGPTAVKPAVDPNRDRGRYELDPALHNSLAAVQSQTTLLTKGYQIVRGDAKDIQDRVNLFYGAISTLVLPILYALLGVCAYLLRLFQREMNSGAFSNSYDISARFFVGLIGGFIVGLFSNFNATGASLSPLALAFLVGYASDVFFSFLESLVANVRKPA